MGETRRSPFSRLRHNRLEQVCRNPLVVRRTHPIVEWSVEIPPIPLPTKPQMMAARLQGLLEELRLHSHPRQRVVWNPRKCIPCSAVESASDLALQKGSNCSSHSLAALHQTIRSLLRSTDLFAETIRSVPSHRSRSAI